MKKQLFSDSSEYTPSQDNAFSQALKTKKFLEGKSGKALYELQKSYKDDKRFQLNKNFKDIDYEKVPKTLKSMTDTFDTPKTAALFDKKDKAIKSKSQIKKPRKDSHTSNEIDEAELNQEKSKNINLLSQIIPNEEFLKENRKQLNPSNLLIKRFDPLLGLGKELINDTQKTQKSLIKLKSGFSNAEESNDNPKDRNSGNKANDLNLIINKLYEDDNRENKFEVKHDIWKSIISSNKGEKTLNSPSKSNQNITRNPTMKIKNKTSDNKNEDIKTENTQKDKNADNEARLLNKKRKKEKKDRKRQEELERKEKVLSLQNKLVRKKLLRDFNEEKVENYMRMVDLVSKKKKVSKRT